MVSLILFVMAVSPLTSSPSHRRHLRAREGGLHHPHPPLIRPVCVVVAPRGGCGLSAIVALSRGGALESEPSYRPNYAARAGGGARSGARDGLASAPARRRAGAAMVGLKICWPAGPPLRAPERSRSRRAASLAAPSAVDSTSRAEDLHAQQVGLDLHQQIVGRRAAVRRAAVDGDRVTACAVTRSTSGRNRLQRRARGCRARGPARDAVMGRARRGASAVRPTASADDGDPPESAPSGASSSTSGGAPR